MAVTAAQHIAQGQFVAQYAGEILRNAEADNRLAQYDASATGVGHALLVGSQRTVPFAVMSGVQHDQVVTGQPFDVNFPGSSGDAAFRHSMPAFQH